MADLDAQIKESQAEVAEAQAKIAEVTSRIEAARQKMATGDDIVVDIENASLDDVHAHTEAMNANIAELIMGLDDVTAGFSQDFNEMRTKTGMESFIGIFSQGKADSMRQERMRTASIDDKLQDLICDNRAKDPSPGSRCEPPGRNGAGDRRRARRQAHRAG